MKLQKAQETGERKPRTVMINQAGATTPISKPARHGNRRSTTCMRTSPHGPMNCMPSGACREGCAVDDWLDAEREIVSGEFPVSPGSGRGDSL